MATKQTTFKATFSNGEVITRTSHHDYKTAGRWINRNTGEGKAISFSTTTPKSLSGYVTHTASRYGMSYKERVALRKKNAEALKVWRWEVVQVEIVK
jgi:hypothetical protein